MDERTISAIGMAQILNGTGICHFMSLRKPFFIITANHFVHIPMYKDVIDALNALASIDARPIPINPIFRYHNVELRSPDFLTDLIENLDLLRSNLNFMTVTGYGVTLFWDENVFGSVTLNVIKEVRVLY